MPKNSSRVVVNDRIQNNYDYEATESSGRNFHPEFTPGKMLAPGVFSGKYMTDCRGEFPKSWFTRARPSPGFRNPRLNFFRVREEKGCIYPDDPRGWFQWYCRYYRGRRCPGDLRQIKHWKAMRRHIARLKKHCIKGDAFCCPGQRQALLHWAYDSRKPWFVNRTAT